MDPDGGGGGVGCPRNEKKNFGSNRNKRKQDLFRVCFGLFHETKKKIFGLFRCFEPISKQPKQTELFRNEPKQWLIVPKNGIFQTLAAHINYFWKEDKDKTPYKTEYVFLSANVHGCKDVWMYCIYERKTNKVKKSGIRPPNL